MTELDHEVVKGLCDRMNTIYEIYKKKRYRNERSELPNKLCVLKVEFEFSRQK